MKMRKMICLLLMGLMLAGCAGTVQQEDISGCWYMGCDREYRYLTRFDGSGNFEILWVPKGDWAEVFPIEGSYTLEEGILNRTYSREMPENSVLTLPAALTLRDGALILSYGEMNESWPRLTAEAESFCLSRQAGKDCGSCAGLGILGYRNDLPVWCGDCCGVGAVAEE